MVVMCYVIVFQRRPRSLGKTRNRRHAGTSRRAGRPRCCSVEGGGARGAVCGIDLTDEQRAKAERLRDRDVFRNVTYLKGYIEAVPLPDASADLVSFYDR